MNYANQGHVGQIANPVEVPSLIRDGERLLEALHNARIRISKIADTLHGAIPRDASGGKGEPSPVASVRRNLDQANTFMLLIEEELTRVESHI